MTSRDFCYWLQGFLEVSNAKEIAPEQLVIIKNHLAMVFAREIDPSHGDAKMRSILDALHKGDHLTGQGVAMNC